MALTATGSIRLDYPGDGDWIMERVEGVFVRGYDHSIARHSPEGEIIGGVALCQYLGSSVTCHMAGGPGWLTKTLLWMMFDYAFNQLGVRKVIALTRSDNYNALAQDLRAGFRLECVLRDCYEDAHLMVLTMSREHCRWLDVAPEGWKAGELAHG